MAWPGCKRKCPSARPAAGASAVIALEGGQARPGGGKLSIGGKVVRQELVELAPCGTEWSGLIDNTFL